MLLCELRSLVAAVMFFTRLPVPSSAHHDPADLQRAAAWFPLVGWLVGAVAAGVWWAAAQVWTPAIASGLSLVATLLLTGAFHEDGFADVCDGFGGGYTKERVLEIMRDSRVGAFGAIGVVVMLGLKWQTVAALPLVGFVGAAVIFAGHTVSRAAAVSLMAVLPYVREEAGKAKPLATELSGGRLATALVCGLAPLALLPLSASWALVGVLAVWLVLAAWFRRRLGGYTGDCLGAAQQVTEVVFYLGVLALI
ncbi:MAG: adenosylcobinamide-GDP ribazoletransferase [Opitutus sp.]|nr:adenosylcobinamide-GDP ribazoletransferase [Opitutus sp.]MCS6245883.1 adenosylcobinamide-GDP ribazoletransferase [Opitutus sp.]MCS6273584.1 adenosylcobinamide-GDP ribazoletransferase [Opitutus sp.]MCS6276038.1 adenosylcobinamide-GDP ribazoletransferase [Opitutus sp.]MCS6301133.1 adenosylcobinamide-GDP ribazoletransferase [Opitutus sp.]